MSYELCLSTIHAKSEGHFAWRVHFGFLLEAPMTLAVMGHGCHNKVTQHCDEFPQRLHSLSTRSRRAVPPIFVVTAWWYQQLFLVFR